jgi:hypothetical protein
VVLTWRMDPAQISDDIVNAKLPASPEHSPLLTHGAARLPCVDLDCYSLELEDDDGYTGDKANKGAFTRILDGLRKALREDGEDPLGAKPTEEISRKKLEALLTKGDAAEAALVQSAVEDFSQELKSVIKRFLKLKAWRETQCIVVGGGFRDSRIGELVIERTRILLKTEEVPVEVQRLKGDPDEAGLVGSAHLLPAWMLEGHEAMLAADIGGTNIRVGLVELNLHKAKDLSKARVLQIEHWCHADEKDITRDVAIDRVGKMLTTFMSTATKQGLRLVPVIGVGCPGVIREDGSIAGGTQNLPGNWESARFHLPDEIRRRVPRIDEHEATVILHNDAVVQGLSQLPLMDKWRHWGIFTIGTGLGNARFSARETAAD